MLVRFFLYISPRVEAGFFAVVFLGEKLVKVPLGESILRRQRNDRVAVNTNRESTLS